MDDARIHPRDPAGFKGAPMDGHCGGDCKPQSPTLSEQHDRPDTLGRIGEGGGQPAQPYPQLWMTLRDRHPDAASMYLECAVVVADRDQAPLTAREVRNLLLASPLGGLEPSVAVA